MSDIEHWDERGGKAVYYRKENFYTISPLPFYYKRRKALLRLLTPFVSNADLICDLGCGDGYYINYFSESDTTNQRYTGIDTSDVMLKKAIKKNPKHTFYKCINEICVEDSFDLVFSLAVLAHINDKEISDIILTVYKKLKKNGKYIIFEQVAPYKYEGKNFIRRTIKEYLELGKRIGFEIEEITLISFNFHRQFERYIAKKYYKYFCKGTTEHEKRLHANSQVVFRFLSKLFLLIDINYLKKNCESGWGNIFIVFKKA